MTINFNDKKVSKIMLGDKELMSGGSEQPSLRLLNEIKTETKFIEIKLSIDEKLGNVLLAFFPSTKYMPLLFILNVEKSGTIVATASGDERGTYGRDYTAIFEVLTTNNSTNIVFKKIFTPGTFDERNPGLTGFPGMLKVYEIK